MVTHTKASNVNALGRGASALGGWRFGEIDAFVIEVQPFYMSWQFLDANMTCYIRA